MQSCNNIWLGMGTLYAATPGQSLGVAPTYIYICVCLTRLYLAAVPLIWRCRLKIPGLQRGNFNLNLRPLAHHFSRMQGHWSPWLMKWSVAEDSSWSSRAKSTSMPGRAVGLLSEDQGVWPPWLERRPTRWTCHKQNWGTKTLRESLFLKSYCQGRGWTCIPPAAPKLKVFHKSLVHGFAKNVQLALHAALCPTGQCWREGRADLGRTAYHLSWRPLRQIGIQFCLLGLGSEIQFHRPLLHQLFDCLLRQRIKGAHSYHHGVLSPALEQCSWPGPPSQCRQELCLHCHASNICRFAPKQQDKACCLSNKNWEFGPKCCRNGAGSHCFRELIHPVQSEHYLLKLTLMVWKVETQALPIRWKLSCTPHVGMDS